MKIEKPWEFITPQTIKVSGRTYNVHDAIRMSENLPVREMLMDDMYLGYISPDDGSFMSFVRHAKAVQEADTSFPILMNENGFVIDGRHRLAKLLLDGARTVRFRRFEKDPPECYTE